MSATFHKFIARWSASAAAERANKDAFLSASIRKYDDVFRGPEAPDVAPSALSPEAASSSPNLRFEGLSELYDVLGVDRPTPSTGDDARDLYIFASTPLAQGGPPC